MSRTSIVRTRSRLASASLGLHRVSRVLPVQDLAVLVAVPVDVVAAAGAGPVRAGAGRVETPAADGRRLDEL